MRITELVDKEIDKTEIESKYIWNIKHNSNELPTISRANLSNFSVDFSCQCFGSILIKYYMQIPNFQFYGLMLENFGDRLQYKFISDENFNIKKIDIPRKQPSYYSHSISCYYDNSIFTFESDFDPNKQGNIIWRAKRYFISQHRWENLPNLPFKFPSSCTGFRQKIIIVGCTRGIWVYDIFLGSYSHHDSISSTFDDLDNQMLIKLKGKIYMIILSGINGIYSCNDIFSEWAFLCDFNDQMFKPEFGNKFSICTYYDGAIYYLRNSILFKFDLKEFESKAIGDLRESNENEKIYIIKH